MSQFESSQIRNLAIAGHGDAGKTSLVSAILFTAGATNRLFKVDEGNTITDYDDDEIKRKISISTSICSAGWNKNKINLLDTPGYSDFICDAFPALRSVDIGAFVVNAGGGLEFNLERLWEAKSELPTSRIFLINKLDRENTSFDTTLTKIREMLTEKIIPIAIPIGTDLSFTGLVDLLKGKAYIYEKNGSGKCKIENVPATMASAVEEARTALIEAAAEADDALLEKYLEGETISADELEKAMIMGIRNGNFYPALPISALNNIGISYFLDFVVNYMPSPVHAVPRKVGDTELVCDATKPMIAQVFKTIIDPYTGKMSIFRVYSGTFAADSNYKNTSQNEIEKITGVFQLFGKTQNAVPSVIAGDIGAITKSKYAKTGDTLCGTETSMVVTPIAYPKPLVSFSFIPSTKTDEEKISVSLTRLAEEDPTLRYERNPETNQLIVSGMGQLHLDVTQDRLKRKYGVNAMVKSPKIPYRETVKGTADVRYRHKKQSGGAGQFGEVAIRLMPLPKDSTGSIDGLEFVDMIVGGVIPGQYIPSVEKGVRSTMTRGIIAGYKVTDIRVELYDGKSHPVDSKDIAFQIAGASALKQAFQEASPILLEPIMKIEVVVPETNMGDIIGNLNSKRGRILGMDSRNNKQVIIATVPMSEMLMYESELRSMSGGRGSFNMEYDHYEELPGNLTEAIVAEYKKEKEEQ